jgi:hypothetical protein
MGHEFFCIMKLVAGGSPQAIDEYRFFAIVAYR